MGARSRRAAVVGTGLIGGSIGLGLRKRGWHVTGRDLDDRRASRALELGALDVVGEDPEADITFVATPVGAIVAEVERVLRGTSGLVTDVGSVKASVVSAVSEPRFVGGHPMAGSEQVGVEGATPDLFEGSVWVLTPEDSTPDATLLAVRSTVGSLGAEVVTVSAQRHDDLTAVVSHVPHLTAATLMALAGDRAADHQVLLRLAAGGFRDMTRIASGDSAIWPDICVANSEAIVAALDQLLGELGEVRDLVARHDREGILDVLERARTERRNLPTAVAHPEQVVVVNIPIPDRPGILAEVTTLATELGINILDIEIAHSSEGEGGVAILLVEESRSVMLQTRLAERGFRASVQPLE